MTEADPNPPEWRSRTRLVDEVVGVLREWIYSGRFPPGAPLRQERLAEELNISRTPLREALRMLEREGVVEVLPNRGVRVMAADREKLLAAYELREVVDGLAARLAARRRTPDLEGQLRASLDRQAAVLSPWNAVGYTSENVAFHKLIYIATANDYVVSEVALMRMTAQVFVPVPLIQRGRATTAIGQHREIVDRILAGDEYSAEEAARRHIRTTVEALAAEGELQALRARG